MCPTFSFTVKLRKTVLSRNGERARTTYYGGVCVLAITSPYHVAPVAVLHPSLLMTSGIIELYANARLCMTMSAILD